MEAMDGCDAVVNLAGANIFIRRWNDEVKTAVRDSRVRGTENIVQALARAPRGAASRPKVLVNASAIGYFGATEGASRPRGDE